MFTLTVADIIDRIELKLRQPRFTRAIILTYINQCNVEIAAAIDIKELATVEKITLKTGKVHTDLPVDFQKNFVYCYDRTHDRPIQVFDSRRLVDRAVVIRSSSGGQVYAIANDSSETRKRVYYQHSPTSDIEADVYYHRYPNVLHDDVGPNKGFPKYIPANLVHKLFYNGTCMHLYDVFEDGALGEKVNTLYHRDEFNNGMEELTDFIGPDPDDPWYVKHNVHFNFEDL